MALLGYSEPKPSFLGIAILIAAAVFMPLLAREKRRLSAGTVSAALRADAAESALCGYLSLLALVGLVENRVWHAARADSIAALLYNSPCRSGRTRGNAGTILQLHVMAYTLPFAHCLSNIFLPHSSSAVQRHFPCCSKRSRILWIFSSIPSSSPIFCFFNFCQRTEGGVPT